MNTVSTLNEFAQELLAEAESALATTSGGVPGRSYVALQQPAFDCCPMLTVHVSGMGLENTSPVAPSPVLGHRPQMGLLNLATFVITVVRCTPQPTGGQLTPPQVAALQVASAEVQQDLWAIWNRLTYRFADGMFEGRCFAVYLESAIPVNEAGMCAGWLITVRTAIQGYPIAS